MNDLKTKKKKKKKIIMMSFQSGDAVCVWVFPSFPSSTAFYVFTLCLV